MEVQSTLSKHLGITQPRMGSEDGNLGEENIHSTVSSIGEFVEVKPFIQQYMEKKNVLGAGVHPIEFKGQTVWPNARIPIPSNEYIAILWLVRNRSGRNEGLNLYSVNCMMEFPDANVMHRSVRLKALSGGYGIKFRNVESPGLLVIGRALFIDGVVRSQVLGNYGVICDIVNLNPDKYRVRISNAESIPNFDKIIIEVEVLKHDCVEFDDVAEDS
jgi:hypothetical protein